MKNLLIVLALIGLTGCGSVGLVEPRNIFERIDQAYVTADNIAIQTAIACGQTERNGECPPGNLITTEQKLDVKARLETLSGYLFKADLLANAGDLGASGDWLDKAVLILTTLQSIVPEGQP